MLQRGIKTIGDLLARPELAARYLDLSESAAHPHHHDHSIGNETTLSTPLKTIAEMEEVLWQLVEEVGGRLRQEECFARCLTVKIRYSNFQTITRSRTLASPTCFDKEIFRGGERLAAPKYRPGPRGAFVGRERQRAANFRLAGTLVESSAARIFRTSVSRHRQTAPQIRRAAIGAATPRKRSS